MSGVAERASGRLGRIEGLRALAACLVLYYHLQRSVGFTHPGIVPGVVVTWSERLGPFGVGIFFVLSGFLLYRPFARAALSGSEPPRLGRYFLRRFTRIYPAYWAALAVLLYVVGPPQVNDATDFVVFFGLFQNYRTGSLLRGLGVAWTLVIEVSFYLVLPVLAAAMRPRPGSSMRVRMHRQLAGLALLYSIGVGVRVWALWVRTPGQGRVGSFQPWLTLDSWLPGRLDWFALGMLLAVVVAWMEVTGTRPRIVEWLAARSWPAWGIAVLIYGLVLLAPFPKPGMRLAAGSLMLVDTALPLAAFFVVAPIALAPRGRGAIRAGLGSAAAVGIGTVAYGIYLWHLVANFQVSSWIADGTLPRSAAIHALLVVTLTGLAATLSYFLIEAPLMRWSAALGRGSRGPSGTEPVASAERET